MMDQGSKSRLARLVKPSVGIAIALAVSMTVFGAPAVSQNVPKFRDLTDPAVVRDPVPDQMFNVYRPRDLMERKRPVPVIAWGNGDCMTFDAMAVPLMERWAAAGYVVIAVNDPQGMSKMAAAGRPNGAAGNAARSSPQAAAGMLAGVEAQTAAQIRMLDWAEAANRNGGRYAGKLDTKRMVLAGNSCGGVTAINAAWRDKRAKSIFIVSGSANFPGTPDDKRKADAARIPLPTLYIVGGPEDLARAPVDIEWSAMRPDLPAVLVKRSSGDHVTVSTDPDIQLDEAAIGLNWFRATLYGDKKAARELAAKGCRDCNPATWAVQSRNLPGMKQ